jgi:hypothetical protein
MARMRGVIRCSISRSVVLSVSDLVATNTGLAPGRMTLAVETKVHNGTIFSSPGYRSQRSAASSSAVVHDVVSKTHTPWFCRRL